MFETESPWSGGFIKLLGWAISKWLNNQHVKLDQELIKSENELFQSTGSLPPSTFRMASHTSMPNTGPTGNHLSPGEVTDPPSLLYSSSCVVYMFLGKRIGHSEEFSTIWMRITRADLQSVDTFKQALTRYLQSATDLGMTHYYPYLGDIMM